jgi:uncharacterized protein YbaR (Trm112 family)
MSEWKNFCCPQCRGPLTSDPERYRCPVCSREYPILFGLPDFRLSPDPYISFEDEYEKARILADKASRVSFENLVRFYWEITPEVPHAAVERYVRYALSGEDRGNACLEALDNHVAGCWAGQTGLEIGCGTGGFFSARRSDFIPWWGLTLLSAGW